MAKFGFFFLLFFFFASAVCDDTCREAVLDQSSGLLVCTISGHCFDRWLSPDEESDPSDIVSWDISYFFMHIYVCM